MSINENKRNNRQNSIQVKEKNKMNLKINNIKRKKKEGNY